VRPKNYQRSDERIRRDVSDRLSDDPYADASEIEVAGLAASDVDLSSAAFGVELPIQIRDKRVPGHVTAPDG
jgi:hypothetical protein